MSAVRSTTKSYLIVASPHRPGMLSRTAPHLIVSPHSLSLEQYMILSQPVTHFCSSCHLCTTPQSAVTPTSTPSNKMMPSGSGRGRGHGPQQQTISKVLQQVHLSSWVKDGLGSIFNGLGSFASTMPTRVAQELNRIVWRRNKHPDPALATKNQTKMQVFSPVINSSDAADKSILPKLSPLGEKILPKTSSLRENVLSNNKLTDREQYTFEKAMEYTHKSVASYYDTSALVSPPAPSVKTQEEIAPPMESKTQAKLEDAWSIFRQIPFSLSPFGESQTQPVKKKALIRKDFVSRSAIEARTKALVLGIKTAHTTSSKLTRTEDLNKHLRLYPNSRAIATNEKVVPFLLKMVNTKDELLVEEAREALALLGYIFPLKSRGIRILTLDGGGIKGLLTMECLKKLEEFSGLRIYELFDYVCGVSTGALIATLTCLYRLPLAECESLYREFSREMFTRNRVMGTSGLVWNHAFYNSEQWEQILKKEMGDRQIITFARDPNVPKMSAVSSIINTPKMKNFLFRNYNLPPDCYSLYPGSCTTCLWEAIRASSAAPGYYEAFTLGDYVHADGGLLTNNPTALAVHEARLLWPGEAVQCVVSLGTGRFEPTLEVTPTKLSLKEKVSKIVDSATDTEAVHMVMTDLMPPCTYFRFNPYLSEDLLLDEIRSEKLEILHRDTHMYLRKNEHKLMKAVEMLKQPRKFYQNAIDWLKIKADMV